ncbi:MAG: hypothetical protein U0361_19125 [Nitrospiraceae bacterium]
MDGLAIRVPTPNVSLVDLTVVTEKDADVAAVNGGIQAGCRGADEEHSGSFLKIRSSPSTRKAMRTPRR